MPYPESCPECGSQFRNTGTHFTARRNEIGRHVLLELGCQNTSRRYWWDFTAGQLTDEAGRAATPREALVTAGAVASGSNGANGSNGTGYQPAVPRITIPDLPVEMEPIVDLPLHATAEPPPPPPHIEPASDTAAEPDAGWTTVTAEPEAVAPESTAFAMLATAPPPEALKDAFVRQLQLDRLTLRQMRSLLMSDEARKAIEVAVGATEATYERLALILFGADLPQLMGKTPAAAAPPQMSAEERLELQREKARIRARLRRAAIKAAKLGQS